jgi:hypothetical protein
MQIISWRDGVVAPAIRRSIDDPLSPCFGWLWRLLGCLKDARWFAFMPRQCWYHASAASKRRLPSAAADNDLALPSGVLGPDDKAP